MRGGLGNPALYQEGVNVMSRVALLPVAALVLVACGSSTDVSTVGSSPTPAALSPSPAAAASPTPSTAAQGTPVVSDANATVSGSSKDVLTDSQGMTLYYRTDDGPQTANCTGGCAGTWPPLTLTSGDPTSSKPLPGSLGILSDANGRQVLYNGHPLYRFASDGAPGQARGEGLAGIWHVVTPGIAVAH